MDDMNLKLKTESSYDEIIEWLEANIEPRSENSSECHVGITDQWEYLVTAEANKIILPIIRRVMPLAIAHQLIHGTSSLLPPIIPLSRFRIHRIRIENNEIAMLMKMRFEGV